MRCVLFAVLACSASAGIIVPSYNLVAIQETAPGILPAAQPQRNLANRAVVENAISESQLPQELLNPFYKNPAIAEGLAKESWLGDGEFPVHHREAEKIQRQKIYSLIKEIKSAR